MSNKINVEKYIGTKHFYLTIVSESEPLNANRRTTFLCKCDCGNYKKIEWELIKYGKSKSCGCLRATLGADRERTHNLTNHKLYKVWANIITRCTNEKYYQFNRYGGRGIKICELWRNDFKCFYDWAIKNGWMPGLQIDRKENDGNYEPDNCRIVTPKVNANNKSNNLKFDLNNSSFSISDLCQLYGLKYTTLYGRIKKGIPIDKALGITVY